MTDLSGAWRGIFSYPAEAPATGFEAVLEDRDGALTGATREPALTGGDVSARVNGRRAGAAVTFIKLYDRDDKAYDEVHYAGTVDADGCEITGRWTIPGVWSGSFIMMRERGVEADATAQAAVGSPR